jgi:FixJ family two-component response regulator
MTTPPAPGTRGISVAIIDDEPSVATGLGRLCRVLGLSVTVYGSGREFIVGLEADAMCPDCVLLDAQMPDMTGLDVQQYLSARRLPAATVIVTADDAPEIRARYLAAGATDFLYKPVDGDELLAVIARAVERVRDTSRVE